VGFSLTSGFTIKSILAMIENPNKLDKQKYAGWVGLYLVFISFPGASL
jgi:hypothetical protein